MRGLRGYMAGKKQAMRQLAQAALELNILKEETQCCETSLDAVAMHLAHRLAVAAKHYLSGATGPPTRFGDTRQPALDSSVIGTSTLLPLLDRSAAAVPRKTEIRAKLHAEHAVRGKR